MSFLKGLFRGDPAKSAAKHEKRAKTYQQESDEKRAGQEWAAAGRDYARIPNLKRARECFVRAAQFFLAISDARQEEVMLRSACDLAIDEGNYEAAASTLDFLIKIGTRQKDNQLLLHALALKTLAILAANDLAKAKETNREAQKVGKRMGRVKARPPLYQISQALTARLVDGEPIPDKTILPERTGEAEAIDRFVSQLMTIYQTTKDIKLKLSLRSEDAKIKEHVRGTCSITSPVSLKVLKTVLFLPSNFSQVEPIKFEGDKDRKFSAHFIIEAYLAGQFVIGPAIVALKIDNQHLQLKSSSVPLRILAAKPRLQIIVEPPPEVRVQEEFELALHVDNNSHGDASDINIRITLPPSLLLQTGTLEKRIITLPAQQHVQFPLFLIATKSGTLEGTIECQYLGPDGGLSKVTSSFEVNVEPRPRKPKD
ncbi:MAG: hypothetical protein ACFFDP_09445 [Promethearchaeota archaeon]